MDTHMERQEWPQIGPIVQSGRTASIARGCKGRLSKRQPWPNTAELRGQALRDWMLSHHVSYNGLSSALGISPSTLTAWGSGRVDLVILGREDNVRRLILAVRQLEPTWGNEDLWRYFGVPEERRGLWRFPEVAGTLTPVTVPRLGGVVSSEVPLEAQVRLGARDGLLLWKTDAGEWMTTKGWSITPRDWELWGRISGLTPLV